MGPSGRLLLLFCLVSVSWLQNPDFDVDDKTALFNDDFVKRIETEEMALLDKEGRLDHLRHQIGVLAMYFRIFKDLFPTSATLGFKYVYPVQTGFHSELARVCSTKVENCLNYTSSYLRKTQPWLTGEDGAPEETELTRERMEQLINDNAASLEISAIQILCWMTMREVLAFEYIPFCGYQMGNDTRKIVWPAKLHHSQSDYIDEFVGDSFACARQSFCPDPCCHDVDPNSLHFTESECQANACKNPSRCYLQSKLNDDLQSQRENKWNVSCPCNRGMFFRPDVAQCVHENICAKEELCGENEECLNVVEGDGYKCVCQLGFVRGTSGCVRYGFSKIEWSGPALTETSSSSGWVIFLPLIILLF